MHEASETANIQNIHSDLHITSLVVHVMPEALAQVTGKVATFDGVQVHGSHPSGKLVVTLEASCAKDILDCMSRIEQIKGVINASLVYQHVESAQSLNQEGEYGQHQA